MISRAIKYMQNNPESVTLEDLNVLKDYIFKVADDVTILQSQIGLSQDFSTLENRLAQAELEISQLRALIPDAPIPSSLAKQVQFNSFISWTALGLSIVGIVVAILGL